MYATAFRKGDAMKWIDRIKRWFKREPVIGPEPGPVFRRIFRRMTDGAKITDQINIER
jgi:hypothetical protein